MQAGPIFAEAENLDMKAVARVAQNASVKEIYLVATKANRDPLVIPPETLSLKYESNSKVLQSSEDTLPIRCNFAVAAYGKKKPDTAVMNIEASFCIYYIIKDLSDFKPEDIEHFSKINPIYNLWSFWREFVQSMTSRMGLPTLTIPLLHIVPQKKTKEQEKCIVKGEPKRRKKTSI
jgi:hypothetical protein